MLRPGRLLTALVLALILVTGFVAPAEARRNLPSGPFFVDTDIGVDDAVAIAYLLAESHAQVIGFTTVFGNASVDNATRNLLTLLDVAERDLPVTVGAADPLVFPRTRTAAFVHGPDGLWFAQHPQDISTLPTDAPAALAAAARDNPGLTIIALGPLTNIARAVEQYPAELAGVRLVALGGGKHGNSTPVAEFNIYADPHALEVVLASQLRVELVTLDAFEQVTVDVRRFPEDLAARGGLVGAFLAPLTAAYFQASTQGVGDKAAIPDLTAAVYALQPDLGMAAPALVRVITDSSYARGQTIIGDSLAGRMSLLASDEELSAIADQFLNPGYDLNGAIGAILQRQPDNTQVVLDVYWRMIVRQGEKALFQS